MRRKTGLINDPMPYGEWYKANEERSGTKTGKNCLSQLCTKY
jgi:hypothetical protein